MGYVYTHRPFSMLYTQLFSGSNSAYASLTSSAVPPTPPANDGPVHETEVGLSLECPADRTYRPCVKFNRTQHGWLKGPSIGAPFRSPVDFLTTHAVVKAMTQFQADGAGMCRLLTARILAGEFPRGPTASHVERDGFHDAC